MKAEEIVFKLLGNKRLARKSKAQAFAPANIALCKYWGKRDICLNLPINSSLSLSLGNYGACTEISLTNGSQNIIVLNGKTVPTEEKFFQRLSAFLSLVIPERFFYINTNANIPIGAGLASSACGFAALVLALNDLFAFKLPAKKLSILARLGSGSATRSLWHGFVEWHAGTDPEGMDSYAEPLPITWPNLNFGLLILDPTPKHISSSNGMEHTKLTSPLYTAWPEYAKNVLAQLKQALLKKNFTRLGTLSEQCALAMHALTQTASPPIIYSKAKTLQAMHKIIQARKDGLEIYFTQDAGANIKLLFLDQDASAVKKLFPELIRIRPFHVEH